MAVVDAWMSRAEPGVPAERVLQRFEHAFGALSRRAEATLSDVTLWAIIDRVLRRTRQEHPLFGPVEMDGIQLRCDTLRARAAELDHDQLRAAIRFALTELLVVVGNLTAEILTPALHAELANEPQDAAKRAHSKEPGS